MKNVILIGGGDIATHYNALLEYPDIHLAALCDLEPDCPARELFRDIPFIEDYRSYEGWDRIDHAIVAATASAHYSIISDLLRRGISVVSEKPLASGMDEVEDLYRLADENGAELRVLFHWRYLIETEWFMERYSRKVFAPLRTIRMELYDDYAAGGTIRPDRRGMMGAWADCGINALSFTDLFTGEEEVRQTDCKTVVDPECGYPVYAYRRYLAGDVMIEISVDWREKKRDKVFSLGFEGGDVVDIIHRKGSRRQEIDLNGERAAVFETGDSLADQYRRMFREVILADHMENRRLSLRLHRTLFTQ